MGQLLTDVLNADIETVRKGVLPIIYQLKKDLAVQRVMKNTEAYRITKTTNADDFRAPLKTAPAGYYGAVNLDGGNLGLGVGFSVAQLIQTFFSVKMGFQMSYASVQGTATTDQSVVNVFRETMKDGTPMMARYEDIAWHNLGGNTGQVGIVTTTTAVGGGTETFTMDPEFGARLMLPNQRVEIFSSNLVTWRTSAVSPDNLPYVQSVNYVTRQVVVTNLGVIVPANGDYLFLPGCTATPIWANGLYYVSTTATSGSYLGLSRTTYPQINPCAITSGGIINPQQILALKKQIKVRAGDAEMVNLIGLASPHQIAQMSAQVQAIQFFLRNQVEQKQIDPLPQQPDDGVIFGEITHYEDLVQGNDRIDYPNTSTWGRVYLDRPGADFYRDPGSNQMFFPQTASGTNAGYAAGTLFYLICTENWYNVNPQMNGLITGLTPPASDYSY